MLCRIDYFYLNNPDTKLTIEEFNRDNEIFVEVEPESLCTELNKEAIYGKWIEQS